MQLYVNKHAGELARAVIAATPSIPLDACLEWVSPHEEKRYKEYFDEAFLHVLGFDAFRRQLEDFWPKGGPHWDALAKVDRAGNSGAILVEPKPHPTHTYQRNAPVPPPPPRKIIKASLRRPS